MNRTTLTEPVYNSAVLVLSGGTEEEGKQAAQNWFKENDVLPNGEEAEAGQSRARTFIGEGLHFAIWRKSGKDVPSLVHEAVHVGVALMGKVGIAINPDNDEPLAYYVDWLVGAALKKSA